MKNDTFFHNVNPRLAQTVMRTQNKSKTVNQELLQLISKVRLLEDNLLEQQYRHQILFDTNNEYKQRLHVLRQKNEAREQHLKKLDEEMELHKIKNKELHICQQSLKILQKQIYQLNQSADNKEDQCESLKRDSERIRAQNLEMQNINKQAYEKCIYTNSVIQDFLNMRMITYDEDQPVDYLRVKLQNLRQMLYQIQSKQAEVKKQQMQWLNIQKQRTIKLQFQEQLLQQRQNDDSKIKAINEMCQNQQNLQKVVQEMLVKEDELVEEVKRSKFIYEDNEKTVAENMRRIEQSWDEERQSYYRELRELKMLKQRLMYQTVEWQKRVNERKQKFSYRSQEQQMMIRMNGQLLLMKRLRQAQQKNNYLKLKIKQSNQIKGMMKQQKDIIKQKRFNY